MVHFPYFTEVWLTLGDIVQKRGVALYCTSYILAMLYRVNGFIGPDPVENVGRH